MHTRLTTLHLDPDRVDEVIAEVEETHVPELRRLDGFRGFIVLVDRKQGKVIAASFWQTDDQLKNSEEVVARLRERAAKLGGADGEPETERYEVALDVLSARPKRRD
jgi:heme-degrading monooxygenase HmoA